MTCHRAQAPSMNLLSASSDRPNYLEVEPNERESTHIWKLRQINVVKLKQTYHSNVTMQEGLHIIFSKQSLFRFGWGNTTTDDFVWELFFSLWKNALKIKGIYFLGESKFKHILYYSLLSNTT